MTHPTRPRRRVLRWILYIALALIVLLLLAAGGGAWWLWGWRLGGLTFHESWSEPQRAEMLGLADELRGFQRGMVDSRILHTFDGMRGHGKMNADGSFTWHPDILNRWEEEWVAAMVAKLIAAPTLDTLRRIASKGQNSVSPQEAGLVAQAAIRSLRPQLAAELIRCGADVNVRFIFKESDEEVQAESTFQCTLAGKAYFCDKLIPLEDRLALLDLMLEHGADIAYKKANSLISAYISAAAEDTPDHGAVLEWLLSHGLVLESADEVENAAMTLTCQGALPTFKRLVQKGLFPLTLGNKARLLSRIVSSPNAESESKALWVLDELGADPDFTLFFPMEDEDDEGNAIVIQKQAPSTIETIIRYLPYHETEEKCRYALRLLELLLEHGAELPANAADRAPAFAALRDHYIEIISKYMPQDEN